MDIDQLLAFDRIAREGSFSRAARQLDITQPTISARIQTLEQEVGGQLFTRGGRKIGLTERGEAFLAYVQRALAVLNEGIEAARQTEAGQRGRVSVGTLQSLAGGFLAATLVNFHQSHPRVDFFVRTGHSNQVVEMLYDGLVKLGLISWPFYNNDIVPLMRFREPLILVAPAGSQLAEQKRTTLEQAKQAKGHLLLVDWGPSATSLNGRIGTEAGPMTELPLETARHILLSGLGAAFVTRASLAPELASGKVVEVEVEDVPRSYRDSALVCLTREQPLSAVLQEFTRLLREEAGEICLD